MIIPYCNKHGKMKVDVEYDKKVVVFKCFECNAQYTSEITKKDYLSIEGNYDKYKKELIKIVDEAIELLCKYEDINLKSIAFGLKMAIERIKK